MGLRGRGGEGKGGRGRWFFCWRGGWWGRGSWGEEGGEGGFVEKRGGFVEMGGVVGGAEDVHGYGRESSRVRFWLHLIWYPGRENASYEYGTGRGQSA